LSRKKVLRQVEKEACSIDSLIEEILSYSVGEGEFLKAGNNYIIDGKEYKLTDIIDGDPVVLVFLSESGSRIDVTPYSEVIINES
jgi:hypothetical protein